MFANTPEPPYYVAIFSSQRTEGEAGYGAMAARMVELEAQRPAPAGPAPEARAVVRAVCAARGQG